MDESLVKELAVTVEVMVMMVIDVELELYVKELLDEENDVPSVL